MYWPTAASTSGTLRTASCALGGSGWKPLAVTTTSARISSSRLPVIDVLRPAAKTATNTTSPRPTISAAEVVAVRAGLRIAFSRASRPGSSNAAAIGRPIAPAIGFTTERATSATPTNSSTAPPASAPRRLGGGAGAEQPLQQAHEPQQAHAGGDVGGPAAAAGARLGQRVGAQRGHRRDARRAQRRDDGGREGHADADEQRDLDRARGEHEAARGHVERGVEERPEGRRHAEPGEQAEHGGRDADGQRLDRDGGEDLPARRAQRAQQRELAGALGDRDREGVEDDEGADEQRRARRARAARA